MRDWIAENLVIGAGGHAASPVKAGSIRRLNDVLCETDPGLINIKSVVESGHLPVKELPFRLAKDKTTTQNRKATTNEKKINGRDGFAQQQYCHRAGDRGGQAAG